MGISLPPLREKLDDLPLLIDHFRVFFNKKFKKNIQGISSEVLSQFMDYHWPGNVRELEHVIKRAFILCRGKVITIEHIPSEIGNYKEVDVLAAMRAKPWTEIITAISGLNLGEMEFSPNIDEWYMPDTMENIYAAGEQNDVPFMAGANTGDMPGLADKETLTEFVSSTYQ